MKAPLCCANRWAMRGLREASIWMMVESSDGAAPLLLRSHTFMGVSEELTPATEPMSHWLMPSSRALRICSAVRQVMVMRECMMDVLFGVPRPEDAGRDLVVTVLSRVYGEDRIPGNGVFRVAFKTVLS